MINDIKFTSKGKEYSLKLITKQMQADFEQAVWRYKLDKLKLLKDKLSPQEYERKNDRLSDAYLANKFSMMHEGDANVLNEAECGLLLMKLMSGIEESELMNLLSDREIAMDFTLACKAARKASFPDMKFSDDEVEPPSQEMLEKKTKQE